MLSPWDKTTFALPGDTTGRAYTDYPFAERRNLSTSFLGFLLQSSENLATLSFALYKHHTNVAFVAQLTALEDLTIRLDDGVFREECTDILRLLHPNPDSSLPIPHLARLGIQEATFDPVALIQAVRPRLDLSSLNLNEPIKFRTLEMNLILLMLR